METYAFELHSELAKDYEIKLFGLKGKENGRPASIVALGAFMIKIFFFCLWNGRKFDRVIFADIVITPAAIAHWLVHKHGTRITVLYGLDLVYSNRNGLLPRLYGYYLQFVVKCQRVFSDIVAISRSTKEIAEDTGFRNVTLILPALPKNGLVSLAAKESPVPQEYVGCKYPIFYFGRLIPRKGSLWFAQNVLPFLPKGVKFFVSGTMTNQEYANKLIHLENLHYLGALKSEDLVRYIKHSSLVVMPNIAVEGNQDKEGFGLVAIEASAIGCVLVASDLEGIADAVAEGVTGYKVEPNNAKAWTKRIQTLLKESEKSKKEWKVLSAKKTKELYAGSKSSRRFITLLESRR